MITAYFVENETKLKVYINGSFRGFHDVRGLKNKQLIINNNSVQVLGNRNANTSQPNDCWYWEYDNNGTLLKNGSRPV